MQICKFLARCQIRPWAKAWPCLPVITQKRYNRHQHSNLQFIPKKGVTEPSKQELRKLEEFTSNANRLLVLTGAGVSTESGIRDYRSEGIGLYEISSQRPIMHDDFLKKPARRHRYWARNFAGWPIFSNKKPNNSHLILSAMEKHGKINWLVTQNVDGLHQKAGSINLTELHGGASKVQCLSCKVEMTRDVLQEKLYRLNPDWAGIMNGQDAPDGDIIIEDDLIKSFKMQNCEQCNGILKPKIIFFGDNVPLNVKNFVNGKLDESDALFIVGSSTETFSSYRIVLAAKERNMPIAILNIGKTRSDHLADFKISAVSSLVLSQMLSFIKNN